MDSLSARGWSRDGLDRARQRSEEIGSAAGMIVEDGEPPVGAEGSKVEERLRQRLRQEELRARHLRIAMEFCSHPPSAVAKINRARRQVALWHERKSCSLSYIERWSQILGARHVRWRLP